MIISDTHTHLYLKEFDSDRDQVINNAITSNVSRLFLPAIDSSHTQSMLILKKKFPKAILFFNFLDVPWHFPGVTKKLTIESTFGIGIKQLGDT